MVSATKGVGTWLGDRLKGPGGLYNLGNAVGLVSGIAASAQAARHGAGVTHVMAATWDYVAGSPAAAAVTVATVFFFWSGEEYRRAWRPRQAPDRNRNRRGDLLSSLGAVLLGLGLSLLGNPLLAATSGFMHAAGKLGSAIGLESRLRLFGWSMPASDIFRLSVVLSRIPAILLTLGAIASDFERLTPSAALDRSALPWATMICLCIWAGADLMLARGSRSMANSA